MRGRAETHWHQKRYVAPLDDERERRWAAGRAFWTTHLAGAPTVLDLPFDRPRPGHRSQEAASVVLALSEELAAMLRELSRQEEVPLRTTLAAGLAVLLSRYTGEEDILMGLSVPSNDGVRRQVAVRAVNPVVLRADLSGEPTVREVLQRTHATTQVASRHYDVPFPVVVDAVKPSQGANFHPLVQVLLTVEPQPAGFGAACELISATGGAQATGFDVHVTVSDHDAALTACLVYSTDLFERETASAMVDHWRTVLEGMAAEPDRPVGELELLGPGERQLVVEEWGAGQEVTPGPDIVALVAYHAIRRPDAVAVVCEGVELTYGELCLRAGRLARHLRVEGVKPEVPVGVFLRRSADQVIALLAILQAGGAYVPIDTEAPTERIRYVLEDAKMPIVLTHEGLHADLGDTVKLVAMERAHDIIEHLDDEEWFDPVDDEQLAYLIYTSGSTGQPKGVMIERGTISAHSRSMVATYGLGPGDRVLQFGQYTADASLEQILPTLAAGARLIMRGPEIWMPAQLLGEIRRHGVTVMNLWPAYLQQALQEWSSTAADLSSTTLRLVIVGGERLGSRAVQRWQDLQLSGVRLVNAYGPTESTITATLAEVGQAHEPITIGRPLPGRRVYILDHGGRPVPVGVAGELYIGGSLLARGYLNRPDLTAERFVADPFGSAPADRLYRTGDLVRYLRGGCIEYVGRQDDQVKIRGYRIELGEVESALSSHGAVDEAVVVARGDSEDKYLVAYVIARSEVPLETELRQYLEQRLPRYMQPAVIEHVTALPRLASGKPDRRKLPEVGRGKRGEAPFVAPQRLLEQQLVQIWEELLESSPIGLKDNFFHLGGHSLLAAHMTSRVQEVFGKRLALSTVFANPSVELLAQALVTESGPIEERTPVRALQAKGRRTPFFFLHGDWTRAAFYCFALARACGDEQPFYVLEPCEFALDEEVSTFEGIARRHIEAMRGVQSHGPYRLGGFCNGGLLAYEMARQLEAAGEEVEFLGLISPSEPSQSSALRSLCQLRHPGKVDRPQADLYLRTRHALRHLYRRLTPGGSRVQDFAKLVALEPRLEGPFPSRDALYHDYVGVFSWAAAGYKTGIYGGKLTCYWPRQEPSVARTWEPIISRKRRADVEEHHVAGNHMSCVTDHIGELARALGDCLTRVERQAHSAS